jgi:hypothetical protein
MKKLPKKMKQIIKEERFSINTMSRENVYPVNGGLDIDYRITMVKSEDEDRCEFRTPMNNEWGQISVNLKVKGYVEVKGCHDRPRAMEISKATKTTPNYWGGYSSRTDYLWGHELHKRVRKEIRVRVQSEVRNYLKIFGIKTRWNGGIVIKKISFEK